MKPFLWFCLGVAVLAAPVKAEEPAKAEVPAKAEEPAKSWGLEAGVEHSNVYLFRGVDLLDDEQVTVPHLKWTLGGLTASYYGFFGKLPQHSHYAEADFAADYTVTLGKAALTAGAVTYQYNGDAQRRLAFFDTLEIYAVVKFNVLLSPTFAYNQDVDKVKGGYGSFSLSQGFPLGSRAALNLSGSVGFDFHYNNKNDRQGTVNDVLLTVQLPVKLNDHLSIYGQVMRSLAQKSLDDLVRANPGQQSIYGDQTVVTGGALLTF